jgi:glucose-6-phosphate isomerase
MAKKGLTGDELGTAGPPSGFPGQPAVNRTLAYPTGLTPVCTLGQIIALYEHRVFVEGVILGPQLVTINGGSNWARNWRLALQPVLEGREGTTGKDGSTAALAAWFLG